MGEKRKRPPAVALSKSGTSRGGSGRARSSGPTAAQKRLAAQRALAAASGARAARRRRTMRTVVAPVAIVVLAVVVLVVVKVASGPNNPKSGVAARAAQSQVAAAVTGVPATVLNTVGKGSVTSTYSPKALSGAALTAGGKPLVLFVGAEWCPYCAAERWPLAVALSRFGKLSGLGEVSSSPSDVDPNTATLTFHGASYTSSYLALTAKEVCSNQVDSSGPASCNGYAALDQLDTADAQVYAANGGGYPFVDVGGKYLFSASYDPAKLAGKTQAQIAAALRDPSSPVAEAIDGSANVLTAAICGATAGKPASVCTSPGVTSATTVLPGSD